MRKAEKALSLDDILEIVSEDKENKIMAAALKGHLALESLLVELIQIYKPGDAAWRMSFPDKTSFLEEKGIFDKSFKDALDTVNDFRNDFAHIFGKECTVPGVLSFAKKLSQGGVDFTDDLPSLDEKTAVEWYEDELGLLAEIFKHLLFDVGYLLSEAGGRDINAAT